MAGLTQFYQEKGSKNIGRNPARKNGWNFTKLFAITTPPNPGNGWKNPS
ncbi:MAG: hypothetical protein OXR67_11910 [Chloroflexota bacterium]|nr:hypothetical protein [Chloroflexota bacterium]